MRLSLQVATVATAFVIVIGVTAAYLLAQKEFRGKELLDIALSLSCCPLQSQAIT
jgi:ABC-type molybdate transport system permease subunit